MKTLKQNFITPLFPKLLKVSKGFTLAELLIAAAIFAFAVSGILLMFINSAFLDQANRNKSIATTHAEFVMEDIMEYMGSNELSSLQEQIDGGAWDWDFDTINSECSTVINDTESIITTYVTAGENPLDIIVTVSWKDRAQASTRPLRLETLISKR